MNNNQIQPKIFCIGLNKTGTTSLHEAFKVLGLKSIHWCLEKKIPTSSTQESNIQIIIKNNYLVGKKLLADIEEFNAYSDWNTHETNHLFKLLDVQYPGSKFILNVRDFKSWIKSRVAHIKRSSDRKEQLKKNPNNPWFGMNTQAWQEEYYQHHEDVLSYFKNRPQDLLVINVCAGDGWEKLCSFLKLPVPNKLFPHVNKKTFFILMKYHLRKVLPILFKFSIVRKMNNWRKKRNYF